MSSNIVFANGKAQITVPSAGSVAVQSKGQAVISRVLGYPNYPNSVSVVGTVDNSTTLLGPYASGATIIIEAQGADVFYEYGSAPVVQQAIAARSQPAPTAVDVTGAVSAAALVGGIVTSSTAAAVAGTIPAGTVMDGASNFAVNDSFDWSVINTGPNTFTVTAASGHTIVGAAAVATATSGRFRTSKTAANTFVSYRIA